MPIVKLSFGERFLNWYAKNTKLYIRGQQGKDWDESRALDAELAKQLDEWFESLDEIKELREWRRSLPPWE
jgi:hypothetical protein